MKRIYPILKPPDWRHIDKAACCLLSDEYEYPPLIAFAYDAPEQFEFLPVAADIDFDKLFEDALENLSQHNYQWEVFEHDGLEFAASSGHTFSAEKILDEMHMQGACELLSSKLLIAAAPRRTCLFATKHDVNEIHEDRHRRYEMFNHMIRSTFTDDSFGHAPISQAIYMIDDGEIYEVVEAGWTD